tara:strand:- start:117 stop:518 length:402 start_codon:yes stop_codon:yes gene_type:complete
MDRLAHILNRKGIEMTKKLLDKDRVYVPPFKREYIDQIVNIVCDHFKADQEAVTTKSYRGAKEVLSKYVSIYFVYQHYDNLRQIDVASIFNFDRSSVVYALKKIEDYKNYDKQIAKDIEVINKKIKRMYLKQR